MVIFYFCFLSNPSISTCIASGLGRTGAAVRSARTPIFSISPGLDWASIPVDPGLSKPWLAVNNTPSSCASVNLHVPNETRVEFGTFFPRLSTTESRHTSRLHQSNGPMLICLQRKMAYPVRAHRRPETSCSALSCSTEQTSHGTCSHVSSSHARVPRHATSHMTKPRIIRRPLKDRTAGPRPRRRCPNQRTRPFQPSAVSAFFTASLPAGSGPTRHRAVDVNPRSSSFVSPPSPATSSRLVSFSSRRRFPRPFVRNPILFPIFFSAAQSGTKEAAGKLRTPFRIASSASPPGRPQSPLHTASTFPIRRP
jgi:hypothetical protein